MIKIQVFIGSNEDKTDRELTTEKTNFTTIINSLSIPGSEKDILRVKVNAVTQASRRLKRNAVAVVVVMYFHHLLLPHHHHFQKEE